MSSNPVTDGVASYANTTPVTKDKNTLVDSNNNEIKPVKKEKKDKKAAKAETGHVLVYDASHGYHYATLAGDDDKNAKTYDSDYESDVDDEVEGDESVLGADETQNSEKIAKKAEKKAAKKAKKAAKKEKKRLAQMEVDAGSVIDVADTEAALAALNINGNVDDAAEDDDEEESKAPMVNKKRETVASRKRELLPGQINITGVGKKKEQNLKYENELAHLQIELVKLQAWIKAKGLKVVVIFEGRDAAGKGGVIKRITERLNPRICRVCALGTATEREKTQWYFQRYVAQLPAAGEMVLFDRSWYNRGGVERVMDFCNEEEYQEFMNSCPIFEDMLIRSGIILIKYWFSVSDDVQEKRFQGRIADSTKRWKLSPMDVESRNRWVEYSKAKDDMLKFTDTDSAPWVHVHADSKKLARLNCISHLLSTIPYQDLTPPPTILPPRKHCQDYVRPPMSAMKWVPEKFV